MPLNNKKAPAPASAQGFCKIRIVYIPIIATLDTEVQVIERYLAAEES